MLTFLNVTGAFSAQEADGTFHVFEADKGCKKGFRPFLQLALNQSLDKDSFVHAPFKFFRVGKFNRIKGL